MEFQIEHDNTSTTTVSNTSKISSEELIHEGFSVEQRRRRSTCSSNQTKVSKNNSCFNDSSRIEDDENNLDNHRPEIDQVLLDEGFEMKKDTDISDTFIRLEDMHREEVFIDENAFELGVQRYGSYKSNTIKSEELLINQELNDEGFGIKVESSSHQVKVFPKATVTEAENHPETENIFNICDFDHVDSGILHWENRHDSMVVIDDLVDEGFEIAERSRSLAEFPKGIVEEGTSFNIEFDYNRDKMSKNNFSQELEDEGFEIARESIGKVELPSRIGPVGAMNNTFNFRKSDTGSRKDFSRHSSMVMEEFINQVLADEGLEFSEQEKIDHSNSSAMVVDKRYGDFQSGSLIATGAALNTQELADEGFDTVTFATTDLDTLRIQRSYKSLPIEDPNRHVTVEVPCTRLQDFDSKSYLNEKNILAYEGLIPTLNDNGENGNSNEGFHFFELDDNSDLERPKTLGLVEGISIDFQINRCEDGSDCCSREIKGGCDQQVSINELEGDKLNLVTNGLKAGDYTQRQGCMITGSENCENIYTGSLQNKEVKISDTINKEAMPEVKVNVDGHFSNVIEDNTYNNASLDSKADKYDAEFNIDNISLLKASEPEVDKVSSSKAQEFGKWLLEKITFSRYK